MINISQNMWDETPFWKQAFHDKDTIPCTKDTDVNTENPCSHSVLSSSAPENKFEGILQKGPYPPCLRMAGRALLAGYPRSVKVHFS